jgi:hypothetical protein
VPLTDGVDTVLYTLYTFCRLHRSAVKKLFLKFPLSFIDFCAELKNNNKKFYRVPFFHKIF